MNVGIQGDVPSMKKRAFLTSEAILRYLVTGNDELETLVLCKSSEIELLTSDFALYEALGSIKESDGFKLNKLVKLFEVIKLVEDNSPKQVLKDERVEELRKLALKED
jgi:hypothetical protein